MAWGARNLISTQAERIRGSRRRPVWAGPLHDFNAIEAMRADAVQRGWVGDRGYGRKLGRLLDTLYDESRDADLARRSSCRWTTSRGAPASARRRRAASSPRWRRGLPRGVDARRGQGRQDRRAHGGLY